MVLRLLYQNYYQITNQMGGSVNYTFWKKETSSEANITYIDYNYKLGLAIWRMFYKRFKVFGIEDYLLNEDASFKEYFYTELNLYKDEFERDYMNST